MARTLPPARKSTKSSGRQTAGKTPPKGGKISPILRKFREKFPRKTALELALRTGADVKHCEKCLAGTRDLGAGFQQELLRSDDFGKDALIALMGDCSAPWWKAYRRHLAISELRSTQAATQRRLEVLERGGDIEI